MFITISNKEKIKVEQDAEFEEGGIYVVIPTMEMVKTRGKVFKNRELDEQEKNK